MGGPLVHNVAMTSRAQRWIAPVIGAAVFLAVLVGAGMLAGDWVKRSTEMRALIEQIEVSEQAMGDTQQAVRAALDGFASKAPLSDENRAALDELLMDAASAGLREITAAGDAVAAVRTMPWHADVQRAQEAYLAHNRAWQDYLRAASTDPAEFGVTQELVNETFAAAEEPIRLAVPLPDVFDLRSSVNVIFAPPPAVDGSTQQA